MHSRKAGEILLGVGAAGAAVAVFYFLFRPKTGAPVTASSVINSIEEWNPFSPTVAAAPLVSSPTTINLPAVDTSSSSGHIDVIDPKSGKSLLSQSNGSDCTTSAQCASGVCVNGSCVDASEWA